MMYWGYPYMMGYGGGWILSILFWIFIIFLILALVRAARGDRWHRHWHDGSPEKSPTDILKERYAKGEITAEQFEKMKKDIEA